MFMDETIEMSDECGSLASRAELDTSQVGANSPFWVHVALKLNSLSQDGDPNKEGIDSWTRCTSPIRTMTAILLQLTLVTTICFLPASSALCGTKSRETMI
jgi:hypothetical protein